jgi:hypothetical protein
MWSRRGAEPREVVPSPGLPANTAALRLQQCHGAATLTGGRRDRKRSADPRSFDWIDGGPVFLRRRRARGLRLARPASSRCRSSARRAASCGRRAAAPWRSTSSPLSSALTIRSTGPRFTTSRSPSGLRERQRRRRRHRLTLRDSQIVSFVVPAGEIGSLRGPGKRAKRAKPDVFDVAVGHRAERASTRPSLRALPPDGGAVIVGKGFAGRLDLTTLRVSWSPRTPRVRADPRGRAAVPRVQRS